jgi:hypothetical protein
VKLFLAIAAVLAWLFGAMLLWVPGKFYAPTGLVMTPLLATVAQAHGATLVGVGVIDWIARDAEGRGLIGVLGGNLVIQVLSWRGAADHGPRVGTAVAPGRHPRGAE